MKIISGIPDQAISAALKGNWQEAIDLNLAILRSEPADIAALNRLAHAYTESRRIEEAQETYNKVVALDKYNPIAINGLKRLKAKHKSATSHTSPSTPPIHANFIEEPGKTKTTQLVRLADTLVLGQLYIGQPLTVDCKSRSVAVKTENGVYVGTLPDDLSLRLGKFIKAGAKYEVVVKGLPELRACQVFIRELELPKRFKNTPSFPATLLASYHADLPYEVLEEEPIDVREIGEDEEKA